MGYEEMDGEEIGYEELSCEEMRYWKSNKLASL